MEYNFTLQINGIHNKSIDTIFHYNYIQYNNNVDIFSLFYDFCT